MIRKLLIGVGLVVLGAGLLVEALFWGLRDPNIDYTGDLD